MRTHRAMKSKREATADDRLVIQLLCRWFARNARNLPWRPPHRRNGYTALVSEAMLQQTQVARVVDKYRQFLKRFPSVRALAAADEQDVLAIWQGMGYYRRAQNLHRAARMIVEQFAGRVPRDVKLLLQLPGVGRYTAGAIASIAYGLNEPIVDGNVHRVLGRMFHSPRKQMDMAGAWNIAERLVLQAKHPGVFNEALMELGATVCSPRSPSCGKCPVAKFCAAKQLGMQEGVPVAKRAAQPSVVHHHAVVMTRNGKVLVEQRQETGTMWAGMWQTPTIESDRTMSVTEIKCALSVKTDQIAEIGSFVHQTTHRRIVFRVFRAKSKSRRGNWQSVNAIAELPMSNAQRKALRIARLATHL